MWRNPRRRDTRGTWRSFRGAALARLLSRDHPACRLTDSARSRTLDAANPQIPGYVITGVLGRGGMGTAFAAQDLAARRPVVIKFVEGNPVGLKRFAREAEALATLRHPGIVRVHGRGEFGDAKYMVLEHLQGESLAARLTREHQLDPDDVVEIGLAVGEALAYAHGEGLLHRDVKPENVMLTGDRVVLIDFGLTKSLLGEGTQLTATSVMAGTIGYSAPEQLQDAASVDERADVYGLAATLYALLLGHPPGEGETPLEILVNVDTGNVRRPRSVRGEVPAWLDTVVMQGLEARRERRTPSVRAFLQALERGELPGRAPAVWAVGVTAVGVTLLGAYALLPARGQEPTEAVQQQEAPPLSVAEALAAAEASFVAEAPASELFPAIQRCLRDAPAGSKVLAQAQLLHVRAAHARGRYALTIEASEPLLENPEGGREASYLRLRALTWLERDPREVESLLERLAKRRDRWGLLARARMSASPEGAARNLDRLQASDPECEHAALLVAAQELGGSAEGRRARMEASLARCPRPLAGHRVIVAQLLATVASERSLQLLEEVRWLCEPELPLGYYVGLGGAYYETGRYAEAAEAFVIALPRDSKPRLALQLTRAQERAGQFAAAAEVYRERYRVDSQDFLRAARGMPEETQLRIERHLGIPAFSPDDLRRQQGAQRVISRLLEGVPADRRELARRVLERCAQGVPYAGLAADLAQLSDDPGPARRVKVQVLLARDRLPELEELLADEASLAAEEWEALITASWRRHGRIPQREVERYLAHSSEGSSAHRTARILQALAQGEVLAAEEIARSRPGGEPEPELVIQVRSLSLAGSDQLDRAIRVVDREFRQALFLGPYFSYQIVRLSLMRGDHKQAEPRGEILARIAFLTRVLPNPLLKLLGARLAFMEPRESAWFLSGQAWLAEVEDEAQGFEVGGPVLVEDLRSELKLTQGCAALQSGAPEQTVLEAWGTLSLADLGPTPLAQFQARFGHAPDLPTK